MILEKEKVVTIIRVVLVRVVLGLAHTESDS